MIFFLHAIVAVAALGHPKHQTWPACAHSADAGHHQGRCLWGIEIGFLTCYGDPGGAALIMGLESALILAKYILKWR